MPRTCPSTSSPYLAAVDLGSNSFHLLVAKNQDGQLLFDEKHRAKTELAAGLDEQGYLQDHALESAFACLTQFSQVLKTKPDVKVRALGTKTLRDAQNLAVFLQRAETILGHPIEVISGREEARLIYLGAAKAIPQDASTQLVVDIGGGSTEVIVGENHYPKHLSSLSMGCVVYRQRFFADGHITTAAMAKAQAAAYAELLSIRDNYLASTWQVAVASSGTAQTIASVLFAIGLAPEHLITREALWRLKDIVIAENCLTTLTLPGLEPERAAILPAGVAILCAVFAAFGLEAVHYVEGALREGILYDMQLRLGELDPREHSIDALCKRFALTQQTNTPIIGLLNTHLGALTNQWRISKEQQHFLRWATQTRELGLTVAKHQYQKHGAYFLQTADIAGFSRQEQQYLAFLVEAQRSEFPMATWLKLPPSQQLVWGQAAIIFRLALLQHLAREHCEKIEIKALSSHELQLSIWVPTSSTCDNHTLWEQLMERERHALRHSPFKLNYIINKGATPSAAVK